MQLEKNILDINGDQIVCEVRLRQKNALILHGAGKADRKRYYSLASMLLQKGVGVVLFDFSGHGDSTGLLIDQSLEQRRVQAQTVIDTFLPGQSIFYLIGFSMSGQTVCDLLPLYPGRIEAILLGCPGIYGEPVHKMLFGGGEFTNAIRQEGSWNTSTAPAELRSFEGRTVIAIGSEDEVIPAGVIELLKGSAKQVAYCEISWG
jgi:esterase/lipase